MKRFILSAAAALWLPLAAPAGEISPGSVPGNINYQGRLERDNAPITGLIHLYFRVYNSLTATGGACGAVAQPCLWESAELVVQATQGIFSADITPPMEVFAGGQKLYLEVQVESNILTPREPLNSVAYAIVAQKLEDGASVSVTTLTAAYQVLLATTAGTRVGIGISEADFVAGDKVTVNGWLRLTSGGIIFPDSTSMSASGVGSAGNISSVGDAIVLAASGGGINGDVLLKKPSQEFIRITNSGKVGIGNVFTTDAGLTPPSGRLDVDGALYVGTEGIYDRDDGELNVKQDLVVEGGLVRGTGNNYISMGETANTLIAATNNTARVWIDPSGNVGIGLAGPAVQLHAAGDIASNTGVRGGRVSIGNYSTWTNLLNEVKAENNYHLLLQQTNPYNVGIGTDTPREKLHVRGSVRSDYGVIAATGAFTGDVRVNGTFTANSGAGNTVNLSSTVIYGSLLVTGSMNSTLGVPAYLASTQTFTGQSSFLNQVSVSSDIFTLNRIGAGVRDFDFAGSKYLQVGDNKPEFANDNALAYLVGGSNANAKLNFYRGGSEAARFETQSGLNLALVINSQTKTLTDSTYYRIQNSVVWISTGYAGTPSIFVSSSMGIVGIGTVVSDPNWRLTVDGNMRFSGVGNGIFFQDGTSIVSGGAGLTVGGISNNGDAIVQSDLDQFSGGDVILRAGAVDGLTLKSGGNVGVGTINPSYKLHVRGGDLVLGTPVNPYGGDAVEDLVVGGNVAFDGELLQRSAAAVKLSNLIVSGDVYLSTGSGKKTGIGNIIPGYSLDVTGDINASGSLLTGNTIRISNAGTVGAGGLNATWDGAVIDVNRGGTGVNTLAAGGILYGNDAADIGATAVLGNGQLLIGDGSGVPTLATLTQASANRVVITN
ncbi:MAG: hypothetical protein Q7R35_16725, partial [Elusimicrobiota bacterium]|nr:hypothetical protein [Elusimicrobiota bacterium]